MRMYLSPQPTCTSRWRTRAWWIFSGIVGELIRRLKLEAASPHRVPILAVLPPNRLEDYIVFQKLAEVRFDLIVNWRRLPKTVVFLAPLPREQQGKRWNQSYIYRRVAVNLHLKAVGASIV